MSIHPQYLNVKKRGTNKSKVDIHYATRPIYILATICGLGRNENILCKCKSFIYLLKIYPIIVLSVLTGLFFNGGKFFMKNKYIALSKITGTFVTDILWAFFIYVFVVTAVIHHRFINVNLNKKMLINIKVVDKLLHVSQLHYIKFRREFYKITVISIIFLSFLFTTDVMFNYNNNYWQKFSFPTTVFAGIFLIQYIADVKIVIYRLKIINALLIHSNQFVGEFYPVQIDFYSKKLFSNEEIAFTNIWGRTEYGTEDLFNIVILYDKLADIIDIINSTYGIQIFLAIASSFMCVLSSLDGFITFSRFSSYDGNSLGVLVTWAIYYSNLFIVTIWIAEKLINQSKQICVVVTKLTANPNLSDRQRSLLGILSQQIAARPLRLSALFFNIDVSLLTAFISTMTTYTIILLQMTAPT